MKLLNTDNNICLRMINNAPINDIRLRDINFKLGIAIPLVHEFNCLHYILINDIKRDSNIGR